MNKTLPSEGFFEYVYLKYPEADLGLLHHKALHLGCCSSPRSASGVYLLEQSLVHKNLFCKLYHQLQSHVTETLVNWYPYLD